MDCRIELKFLNLDGTEVVRAETNDKSYDLYTEARWNEAGSLAVEGSRSLCAGVARFAVDEWEEEDHRLNPPEMTGDSHFCHDAECHQSEEHWHG